jgi:uncharacterized membrane protein YidH (DUF202 family)
MSLLIIFGGLTLSGACFYWQHRMKVKAIAQLQERGERGEKFSNSSGRRAAILIIALVCIVAGLIIAFGH